MSKLLNRFERQPRPDYGLRVDSPLQDDDTDEFGRMVLQHARDENRLGELLRDGIRPSDRLHSNSHRENIALTRNENEQLDRTSRSPSIASSVSSDPLPTIPTEWGRRSKYSAGWMRRSFEREQQKKFETHAQQDTVVYDEPRSSMQNTARTLQDASRSNVKFEGGESSLHQPQATAALPTQTSQASANTRRRRLADARDLAALSSRTKHAIQSQRAIPSAEDRYTALAEANLPKAVTFNEPLPPGTASNTTNKENRPPTTRPSLRDRLAKAGISSELEDLDVDLKFEPMLRAPRSTPALLPLLPQHHEPQPVANSRNINQPARKSELRSVSSHAPEVVPSDHATEKIFEHTPSRRQLLHMAKTPIVTGAWVQTPQADKVQPKPKPEPKDEFAELEAQTDEGHPKQESDEPEDETNQEHKSALGDLVKSMRRTSENHRPTYGDDTIASLEGIVNPNNYVDLADNETLSQTLDMTGIQAELEALHPSDRTSLKHDKDRKIELDAMHDMNKRLRIARLNIRDAKTGLKRVERKVQQASLAADKRSTQPREGSLDCALHNGIFRALVHEAASLFVRHDVSDKASSSTRRWLAHLTWLGLLASMCLLWYMLENATCAAFCQPEYASRMRGFGVDPNAPRYPYAIPTLLFRPLDWLWKPLAQALFWICGLISSYLSVMLSLSMKDGTGVKAPVHDSSYGYLYGAAQPIVDSPVESMTPAATLSVSEVSFTYSMAATPLPSTQISRYKVSKQKSLPVHDRRDDTPKQESWFGWGKKRRARDSESIWASSDELEYDAQEAQMVESEYIALGDDAHDELL